MRFSRLALVCPRLEEIPSRLAITRILADLLREASAEEVSAIVYLSLGRLGPFYESMEFQLAEKMVMRAIGQQFSLPVEDVRRMYKKVGDLGEVVEKLKTPVFAKATAGKQKSKLPSSLKLRRGSKKKNK